MGACGMKALLISLHILLPVFPFVNVREAEFPVLVRLVDALEETLSLLVFGEMEEDFDDPRAVTVEMFLQVHDGTIAVLPNTSFFLPHPSFLVPAPCAGRPTLRQ